MKSMTRKNPESQNCQYVLTLSSEQALVVEQACELYARLNIGQFETIAEKLLDDYDACDYCRRRDAANSLLRAAAEIVFKRNPYGQLAVSQDVRHQRAWAVYTTLRHRRAWHNNPEGAKTWSVCYDKPMPYGIEPMPKCEIQEIQHGLCNAVWRGPCGENGKLQILHGDCGAPTREEALRRLGLLEETDGKITNRGS